MSGPLPDHECDLVMRGGIASGIAYPEAIATLAEKYRLRAIGGTSAGAIAATVAAAAEYGRGHGKPQSYEALRRHGAALGERINGKARIVSLFGAPAETRILLTLMLAIKGSPSAMAELDRGSRLAVQAMRRAPELIAWLKDIGGSPGVGLAAALFVPAALLVTIIVAGGPAGALLGLVLLAVAVGVPVWAAASLARRALAAADALPGNMLGICNGMRPSDSDEEGLTEWMHRVIQDCAGRSDDGPPLTFADLWGDPNDRDIQLQLITTNVTRGASARLPDLEDTARGHTEIIGRLYFRRSEMARLFPAPVVAHLVRCAQPFDAVDRHLAEPDGDLHRLPPAGDLPIVLAARMSLSFPILLSQVPLWAPDPLAPTGAPVRLVRNWFSDGGITSNFPISIFDGPLPRRPTFGINLVPLLRTPDQDATRPDLAKRVRMPEGDNDFVVTRLYDPAVARDPATGLPMTDTRVPGLMQLLGYLGALNDTARNWTETELATMPGYRDRIVNIELGADEGGLNLDMPPDVVKTVAERGRIAAEVLLSRFHPEGPALDPITGAAPDKAWPRHRWTRMRLFLAAYEELGRKFVRGWTHRSAQGDPRYPDLLAAPPPGMRYGWSVAQGAWAQRTAPALVAALRDAFPDGDPRPAGETFDRGDGVDPRHGRSPRPKMVLRTTAPMGHDPADTFTPLGAGAPRMERMVAAPPPGADGAGPSVAMIEPPTPWGVGPDGGRPGGSPA